jgi:hypothetical protein
MWSNSVGIHIDDYDLISFNYLHSGAPKIWYIISPSSYSKFEELVNQLKLFSDNSLSCLSPLQHQTLLIKPSFLHLHAIEYYKIEQKAQELVVIFPGIYHFYFDTGFNLSETIKYALPSWLEFQRRSPRLCSCSISSEVISNLNRRFFTEEILKKFREEFLTTKSSACIDLSIGSFMKSFIIQKENFILDEEPTVENPVQTTSDFDIQLDQYSDPFYSPSSSMNNPTPNNLPEQEDFWNIFQQISSSTKPDSTRFHPYSSIVPYHPSSMYSSYLPSYPYSSLRTCINRQRRKRRKCYACRRQGHLKNECPYFSHE